MRNPSARWLKAFAAALARSDIKAAAQLFEPEGCWRDLVAFTWTLKTFEGRGEIAAMLAATLASAKPGAFALRDSHDNEAWFSFETAAGRGIGHLRLRKGKCWTLLTALQELKGFEEKAGQDREAGVAHGAIPGRKSWLERRREEVAGLERRVGLEP